MSFAPAGHTLVRIIGRGASSIVWEARDVSGTPVALKILEAADADALRLFEREREAMNALVLHRNILTILAADSLDRRPWLAMELCRRGSLAAYVADGGPLAVPTALRVLDRLADALATAHGAGVVHCDVKPANVLLTDQGEPVLADFGIARVAVGRATTATVAGFSLDHVAPELLDDGGRRSPRSDVYSLGTTVWELLDGQPPFRQTDDVSVGAVLTRILRRPLPESPRVPDDVLVLLRQMTAKDPEERPADMAEVRDAVRALAAEQGIELDETPLPPLTSIQLQVIEALSGEPEEVRAAPTVVRVEPADPAATGPAVPQAPPTFVPAGPRPEPPAGMPVYTAPVAAGPTARLSTRSRRVPLVAASVIAVLVAGGVGIGVRNAVAADEPTPAPVAVERAAVPATTILPTTSTATPEPSDTAEEPASSVRSSTAKARPRATTPARRTVVRRPVPPAPAAPPPPAQVGTPPEDARQPDPPTTTSRKPTKPSTSKVVTPQPVTLVEPVPAEPDERAPTSSVEQQ